MDTYRKGRVNEGRVAAYLERQGWTNVRLSGGSRGPADIYGRTPSGIKAYVQVKVDTARLDGEGRGRLREMAKERNGAALYVHKSQGEKPHFVWLGNWSKKKERKHS